MKKEEMLKVIRRHTTETNFQVMRVAVNYRKRQKQLKIIALHLKSTLATPTLHDGAYTGKLWTASSRNPVGAMKPCLNLLFVQPEKTSLKNSTSLNGT